MTHSLGDQGGAHTCSPTIAIRAGSPMRLTKAGASGSGAEVSRGVGAKPLVGNSYPDSHYTFAFVLSDVTSSHGSLLPGGYLSFTREILLWSVQLSLWPFYTENHSLR